MKVPDRDRPPTGFALPVVLIIAGALMILAVGALLLAGIERRTARLFLDRQRAELAASAALEDVRQLLATETANDDFIILQSTYHQPPRKADPPPLPAPHLFLARARLEEDEAAFRYTPLFSTHRAPQPGNPATLAHPEIEPLVDPSDATSITFATLPYQDHVRVAWIPIHDDQGRLVARYAYWVEDLQAKLDPACAGNLDGPDATHARAAWPFPAPGMRDAADKPALDPIALYAIDPDSTATAQGELAKTLIENRRLLISPGSTLAAAGIDPPLVREAGSSRLVDPLARAAEESLATGIRPYLEQPLVPFAAGINPGVSGLPKLNLNELVASGGEEAVTRMAGFIRAALPDFENRKGGFPEDYLKTLAANAIDYADADGDSTVRPGEFRGLDSHPLLSEIVLQIAYQGVEIRNGRRGLKFTFKLFAELHNPTSQPTGPGAARLSYEVSLPVEPIGSGTGSPPFDSETLLDDPRFSTHDLTKIDGRYWTRELDLDLAPNQYRSMKFAEVSYWIDLGSSSENIPDGTPFGLVEQRGSSGLSLMWNGRMVDRASSMIRQQGLVVSYYTDSNGVRRRTGGFEVKSGFNPSSDTKSKSSIPALWYAQSPRRHYNTGDPRIGYYLRSASLDESAYPENSSPNRRNVRKQIYQNDVPMKPKVYARVLPSEWPDGGHNAPVGTWSPGTAETTEPTAARFAFSYQNEMADSAPQAVSNRGRYFSATELGRIFDPLMHLPAFEDPADTVSLVQSGLMPHGRSWPAVMASQPSEFHGGGNTLRIGRPEHPAFDSAARRGMHAARLLDLFHAGRPHATDAAAREGPLVEIAGHVNINTASRDALRAMAAGLLVMDPALSEQLHAEHDESMMPPVKAVALDAPQASIAADLIADAIIRTRPHASPAEIAWATDADGNAVFGNRRMYRENDKLEWSDAAAEEVFARVHECATVRSRNFRVWIVAQSVHCQADGQVSVLAETRKAHTLFADPGERKPDGSIDPATFKTTWIHATDF